MKNNDDASAAAVPWFRQPWVWFVISLPAASVVASLTLVTIAVIHRDDLVRDDWYKAGRAINQDIEADQRARALGLQAQLVLDPATQQIRVEGLPATLSSAELRLAIHHATLAREDIDVVLQRDSNGMYSALLPHLPLGKRSIVLEPVVAPGDATRWRLRAGDVMFQARPVALHPGY